MSGAGVIPMEAILPEGKYLIIGLYKNAFGIYSTRPSTIFEVKKEA